MAEITSEGFRFDRQYLVVKTPLDPANRLAQHLTIKTTYGLGLFKPSINDDWSELTITHLKATSDNTITMPLTPSPLAGVQAEVYDVSIFGTSAVGMDMGDEIATFFTKHLGISVRILFITGKGRRDIPGIAYIPRHVASLTVNTGGDFQPQRIRFADAAPFLITTTTSEESARERLPPEHQGEDVIVRFRPNIHVDIGATPAFIEDDWRELAVLSPDAEDRKATIRCVFKTPRCLSLNVDLTTGTTAARNNQLYGLMARDRRVNKVFPRKPVFGQYAFAAPTGVTVRVGDTIRVIERAEKDPF